MQKEELESVLRGFAKLLVEFAHFVSRMGELENEYRISLIGPEAASQWMKFGEQFYLLEKDDFLAIMEIFYKVARMRRDIDKLSANEKIDFGKELEAYAKELLKRSGEA